MMRKVFVLILFFLVGFYAQATHLVGGEFEIIHVEGNTYLIRQIQYFDEINGDQGAKDAQVDVSLFRLSDDVYIRNITLFPTVSNNVSYSNPSCSDNRIVTSRLVYEATVELDPEEYNDPEGYYLVWERCCRNHVISNIEMPEGTGQTFYLAFPPLVKDGKRFINSSPQLFPPLSDYGCVNQFYYADFRGTDRDGDSLSYSLVTPYGSSGDGPTPIALPVPQPKPHPSINWKGGYSEDNQVPGNPTLNISKEGILTVTPTEEGLYVFSVMCEEFRDGEKIGEVRRDFQLFVVDCPDPGNKPQAKAKVPGSDSYEADPPPVTINYGDNTCFSLIVNDPDDNEYVRVQAIPVNFVDTLADNFSVREGVILNPTDTFDFEFCFPQCINEGSFSPAIVDIIVYDNRCPQSLMDTIRIEANIEQPPNIPSEITSPSGEVDTFSFPEGSIIDLPVVAIDADNDSMAVSIEPIGFNIEEYLIDLELIKSESGEVEYNISWNTDCAFNSFVDTTQFSFMIIVEDFDECNKINADTAYYSINIDLPPNNTPSLSINGNENDQFLEIKIEELRNFLIEAIDSDMGDFLSITINPIGFELSDLGLAFPEVTGSGGAVQQTFEWQVNCGLVDINQKDTFEIQFIAEDFDRCKGENADTVTLLIKLLPPDNSPPLITIDGNENPDTLSYIIGQTIDLNIESEDPDGDMINLFLQDFDSLANQLGLSFNLNTGIDYISGDLIWQPNCEHLDQKYMDKTYTLTFISFDDKCFVQDTTITEVVIEIQDFPVDYDFLPPNAFTPNTEDAINSTYYIPNLPQNNCFSQFEEIIIFNRWGQEVYRSADRDFIWTGDSRSSGVYYYTLIYSHETYKGIINLVR